MSYSVKATPREWLTALAVVLALLSCDLFHMIGQAMKTLGRWAVITIAIVALAVLWLSRGEPRCANDVPFFLKGTVYDCASR